MSKSEDGATTPQNTRIATLNLSLNIFNNRAVPIEVDQEPKDISKPKEDSFQSAISKHLLAFINTPEVANKPVVLSRPTPSPISKKGTVLGEQVINSSILQSSAWKEMQAKIDTI